MKNLRSLIIPGIGTFILMIVGFYNRYPLVYSDTGTYITCGFDNAIPFDRPVPYGYFIRFLSFKFSLWLIVLIQNFLTAFVIYEVLITLKIDQKRFNYFYFSLLAFLVFFTGIGWYSNQIMPDFLAPISILMIYILLKKENISWIAWILYYLVIIFSLITHFSHMMIGSVLMVLIIMLKIAYKRKFNDLPVKRIAGVALVVFSSWLILPGINYLVEKKFIIAKGNHIFLMAHLADTGILEDFLNKNCKDSEFMDCKLCTYKDSIPSNLADYMWSSQIIHKTGGWGGSKAEYDKIIRATLKQPEYLFLNIYKSISYGVVQLTHNKIGQGLSVYKESSAPYGQIYWRFRHELNNYLNSKQNIMNGYSLRLDTLNVFHLLILILSVFVIIYLWSTPLLSKVDYNSATFLFFIVLSIVINAFVTAGLNSPCDRFQSRVVWMLPFALIILIYKNREVIFRPGYNRDDHDGR